MSYIEDIIRESIKDFKAQKSRGRRREVEKLLNYYTGTNTEYYWSKYFDSQTFSDLPPYKINITRKFIDKMSRVYNKAPKRTFNSNVNKSYNELTRFKDVRMKHIEKMTNLIGTIAIQVFYQEDESGSFLDHRPIYYFDAFFDDNDPYNPIAIVYPILLPTDDVSYVEPVIFEAWDRESHVKYDGKGNIIFEEANPYGRIPFIFSRDSEQIDDFIGEGSTDICNINEHVNITMFNIQYGLHLQMVGQMYATGVYADQPIQRVGPDQIINIPEGGSFGITSPQGNFKDAIDVVKFQLELLAQSKHMFVTFDSSADRPSSGIALRIKDFEHLADYTDDIENYRMLEHSLYALEKDIASFNNISIPNNFSIEFEEFDYPTSVQDQIAKEQFDLDKGFTSREELLQKRKGDITIEEAKKRLNNEVSDVEVSDG